MNLSKLFKTLGITITIASIFILPKLSFAGKLPNIGRPDGYFVYKGMIYAKSGGSICGFLTEGHLDIFRGVYPAPDIQINKFSSYKNLGACSVPEAYFNNGVTVFYSYGDGRYCAFLTQEAFDNWQDGHEAKNVNKVGRLPGEPILKNIGQCPN